jgi:hypothetical protein
VFDDYLGLLAGQLRGPRRLKADLIAEARGSLEDAAAAYQEDGLDARTARSRAVAEFGDARELAPAYQAELTAGQGRRLAVIVALLPVGMLTADRMWWRPPGDAPQTPPAAFLFMVEALDWTSYAAGALALVALLLLGRATLDPRAIVRVLAGAALVTCTLIWAIGTFAAVNQVLEDPRALSWPPMIAAWVMLNGVFAVLVRSATRCLAATRGPVAAC